MIPALLISLLIDTTSPRNLSVEAMIDTLPKPSISITPIKYKRYPLQCGALPDIITTKKKKRWNAYIKNISS